MAEPANLYSDSPDFSNARPVDPSHALPPAEPSAERLTQTAEQIGTAVGTAVHRVRGVSDEMKRRFTVIRGRAVDAANETTEDISARAVEMKDELTTRAVELKDELSARAAELGREIGSRTAEIRDQVSARAVELRDAAAEQAERARVRVDRTAREYPLHVIAGVAAAGFVLGIALRTWRANRG